MPGVDMADGTSKPPDVDSAESMTQDVSGATGRVAQGAAQAEDRALAGSVRADHRPVFASSDRELDGGEYLALLADVVDISKQYHL